jgi:YggT family protein
MSSVSGVEFLLYFISTLFFILQFAIIIRALMSWFNPSPDNPIVRLVIEITEPVLAPLRRIVPRIGMIDITPIVAYFILRLLQGLFMSATGGM